ncbi:FtsX-like permease family protein [Aggregatimonas sangjinii]|uniref:FtsX-like permease family protein n=1 Tax=Aggregatimonas sangjinii TaxID=2583587 RepID=A0A5B7SP77_9FLAO|nr:ABC transporter permease [Aggregatimonas sangjinii]QCW98817.1 FtsX-like permease family protein [Aggregatimonas sangjinii]
MYKNYLKIALRSMVRHRLFTAINVFGLAISMSVGLLMIAFISDLWSYDDFHENKDRMYRVTTTNQDANGFRMNLASSSIKAAYDIRESVPGIEDVTVIRRGFGGDAEIGNNKIPMDALWADNSFLKVFTFPLSHGNPATALQEPYSMVLTEKTAEKLFGKANALGETIKFDSLNYKVTGILKDIPKLSHLDFGALVSFATVVLQNPSQDGDFMGWGTFFDNYTYLLLPEKHNLSMVQDAIDEVSKAGNNSLTNQQIQLSLQPLTEISIGTSQVNEIGASLDSVAIWILVALTFIVLLSACFNYTNLSIARALKRSKEVGIRKVVGAGKRQVVAQFIIESVVISFVSLGFALLLFVFLKEQFKGLHDFIDRLVILDLSLATMMYFVGLTIFIGIVAGLFPAFFFSRIKALQVLKGITSLKLFQRVNLRKSLIVVQYVFSLVFITTTVIGYTQYKSFITYDLGFSTENVLNIRLQGNKADLVTDKLLELPAVKAVSKSRIVTSLGNINGSQLRYKDQNDSISVQQNVVDANYLPLHGHLFLAGKNFRHKSNDVIENEVIINEKLLKSYHIGNGDVNKAIGEIVTIDGKKLAIIGVLKDFHYEGPGQAIQPLVIRYSTNPGQYVNAKISTADWPETLAGIEKVWKELDHNVHELDAKFYDDQIVQANSGFLMIIKVIGFLSFLAICISSLGLFGMVVFTTETKLRDISIRKVLGAGTGNLVYQLSKNFVILLVLSACIALPLTYLLFDKVVLSNFAYHKAIGIPELLAGFCGVLLISFFMIGSQTFRAARTDPAKILRTE